MAIINTERLTKFLISGASAATAEYTAFILLRHLGLSLLVANSISFGLGLILSFSLNRSWVFMSSGNKKHEFSKYCVVAGINLLLSNALIYLEVNAVHFQAAVAKLVAMIAVAAWNYFIFPRVVFKRKE